MLEPDDVERICAFAQQQQRNQRHSAASAVYRGLFEATQDPMHLVAAALSARAGEDYITACVLADILISRFSGLYHACMEAGLCKLVAGADLEACAAFEAAYAVETSADAAAWCGVAWRRRGDSSTALHWHELALQLDSRHVTANFERASCLEELNRYTEAADTYRRLIEGDAGSHLAYLYNRLGTCFIRSGRSDLLFALLDDPGYYRHLDTDYAIESTLVWSLKLGRHANDVAIAESLRERKPASVGASAIDAVTIYLARQDIDPFCRGTFEQLLQLNPYGADAAHIMHDFPLSRIETILQKVHFLPLNEALDAVCDHVASAKPFSLIRLGDGEGNLLGHFIRPQSVFLRHQADKILHNWFTDQALPASAYANLNVDLGRAIQNADLLGVPDLPRIKYELTNDPRGYWGVYFAALHCCHQARAGHFMSPVIHLHLFRHPRFIAALRAATAIHTISCHPMLGCKLRGALGTTAGIDLVVPGEMGIAALPSETKRGRHYPEEYDNVNVRIGQFEPGTVVLVAAGVCGKVYTDRAKRVGCVAIDIGAMADFLMGYTTREIFSDAEFRESHLGNNRRTAS